MVSPNTTELDVWVTVDVQYSQHDETIHTVRLTFDHVVNYSWLMYVILQMQEPWLGYIMCVIGVLD